MALLSDLFPDFNVRNSDEGDRMSSRQISLRHSDDSSTQVGESDNKSHASILHSFLKKKKINTTN